MSCNLSDETLFILNVLYKGRNFKTNAGYHSAKLKKIYQKKFNSKEFHDFDDAIKLLLNDGYVGQIRKKDIKYYIIDISRATFALKSHGFNVVKGPLRRL